MVRFDIKPYQDIVQLTVTHEGLSDSRRVRSRIVRKGHGSVQSQIPVGNRARIAAGAMGDARRSACRARALSAVTLGGMPHPIRFSDDDFGLADVVKIALGFPEAFEKISWGRPVFCATKIFAMYGGNAKGESPAR